MKWTVATLTERLGLIYEGDGSTIVTHACGLESTLPHGISYVENEKFASRTLDSAVQVFVCQETIELPGKIRIITPHPKLTMIDVTQLLHPEKIFPHHIHKSVAQGRNVRLGHEIFLGAGVVIGHRSTIGAGSVVMEGTVIGDDCEIGSDCRFHPNVTIRDRTRIGNRVVINAGSVVGAEGFGFVTHEGKHHKIPQVGTVHIEDDVEIGACNTIDRARFGVTRIGRGTKTDNLVHIGHNVEIGEDSLIVGMVGIAGSTKTGHHLTIGGQAMLDGHLTLGNHVTVSAKSLLAKNVGEGERYSGIPARPHQEWLRANGHLYRLERIFELIRKLKKDLQSKEKRTSPP